MNCCLLVKDWLRILYPFCIKCCFFLFHEFNSCNFSFYPKRSKNLCQKPLSSSSSVSSVVSGSSSSIDSVCKTNCTMSTSLFLSDTNDIGLKSEASNSSIILSRSEEHTSELQSRFDLVCRLLLEKKTHTK